MMVDQTDQERMEEIVAQHNPDTHPYTSRFAAELPAAEWLGVREGVLREMRGRLGLELVARAAVEAAVGSGWAEPEGEAAELVKDIRDELSGSIIGGGFWSFALLGRPDVDLIVDSCYDLVYLAEAMIRGEPAPERYARLRCS